MSQLSAQDVRLQVRNGTFASKNTSGQAPGQMQANIFIIPADFAAQAERVCGDNQGPLPLIYKSKPGETTAPPLASDSDIRRDLLSYSVYIDGKLMPKDMDDLLDFDFSSFVTFYIGCSFSFESALLKGGVPIRNEENKKNVSMYTTSFNCVSSLSLPISLVVSLRPIPASLLDAAFATTAPLDAAHGAPIHFGDPAIIGIRDVMMPDFGDAPDFERGDVATFWCCGITEKNLIKALGAPLAFTHTPGSMFLCDVLTPNLPLRENQRPIVLPLSQKPLFYSVLDAKTLRYIQDLCVIGRGNEDDKMIGAIYRAFHDGSSHSSGNGDNHNDHSRIGDRSAEFVEMALLISHAETIEISSTSMAITTDECVNKHLIAICFLDVLRNLDKTITIAKDRELSDIWMELTKKENMDLKNSEEEGKNSKLSRNLPSFPFHLKLKICDQEEDAAEVGPNDPSQVVFQKDILRLCLSLVALQQDAFHERYKRRGLGKRREIDDEAFMTKEKVTNMAKMLGVANENGTKSAISSIHQLLLKMPSNE